MLLLFSFDKYHRDVVVEPAVGLTTVDSTDGRIDDDAWWELLFEPIVVDEVFVIAFNWNF